MQSENSMQVDNSNDVKNLRSLTMQMADEEDECVGSMEAVHAGNEFDVCQG